MKKRQYNFYQYKLAIVARVSANYILEEKEVYDLGQKVNPHGIRIGITKDWESIWYKEDEYYIWDSGKKKVRNNNRNTANVKQFTRRVMRKSTKRLILPRNRLLA